MKHNLTQDQYIIEFSKIVKNKVKFLKFIASDERDDVSQSIVEWAILHPERTELYPPDELARMNVRNRAIDWKRQNGRQACEYVRDPVSGAYLSNKRVDLMTHSGNLEVAMSRQGNEKSQDVEGEVMEMMNRKYLLEKLKKNLTDLQWNVVYERSIGDHSNNEVAEKMQLLHYNASRAFKGGVAKGKEVLADEALREEIYDYKTEKFEDTGTMCSKAVLEIAAKEILSRAS